MKNIFKTLAVLFVVSMMAFSCDNQKENDPQDPVNDKAENPTNPTEENIPITSQNLQGDWVLVGWKDADYPDTDMSYVYGITLGIYESGVLNMQREVWEDLLGYYDTWFYSSTNNLLIFSCSTLEFESLSFSVNSLTESKLEIIYNSNTLTFEKQ